MAPGESVLIAKLRLRGARFVILRRAGDTRTLFGEPGPRFVAACDDILSRAGYTETWIAQLGRGRRARLAFADNLAETDRQRIRNVWTPPSPPTTAGSGKRA